MATSRMIDYVHAQLPGDSTLQVQQFRKINIKDFHFQRPFSSQSTEYSLTSAQDRKKLPAPHGRPALCQKSKAENCIFAKGKSYLFSTF